MKLRNAVFLSFVVTAAAVVFSAAAGSIGVIKSYDASKKMGQLRWEEAGPTGTVVPFLLDPGSPIVKPGDRVYAVERPVKLGGLMQGPESSLLTNLWVTGLVTPDPSRPAPTPAPAPAAKAAPPAPMGEVKSFDPVKGVGIFVPDGQYVGLEFRPWPGFDFRPMNGARLRYAQDQQFGQKILWVAPPAPVAAK